MGRHALHVLRGGIAMPILEVPSLDLGAALRSRLGVELGQEVELYYTLGIPVDATAEQIRKAYEVLKKQRHPRNRPEGVEVDEWEREYQELIEAYEILSDHDTKLVYDKL